MRILIASDIHGSAYYLRQLLKRYQAEQPDKLLLLGDILYHGPRNDLPEGYAPKEVIDLLNDMKEDILCVRGNCDTDVDQMVLEFPILADYCILYEQGHMIFATHGHIHNTANPPMLKAGDILLHGHTHIPVAEDFERVYSYLSQRLIEANIKKDKEILEEVNTHLRSMRDTWKEVMKRSKEQGA